MGDSGRGGTRCPHRGGRPDPWAHVSANGRPESDRDDGCDREPDPRPDQFFADGVKRRQKPRWPGRALAISRTARAVAAGECAAGAAARPAEPVAVAVSVDVTVAQAEAVAVSVTVAQAEAVAVSDAHPHAYLDTDPDPDGAAAGLVTAWA